MSALYVDAVSVDRWNRPAKEISQADARDFLQEAVNDYSLQYFQRYTELEIIEANDPDLFGALVQWSGGQTSCTLMSVVLHLARLGS
jgi:hypothetical protein